MNEFERVRAVWTSEVQYARDPSAWMHQAWNLRFASEALMLHDSDEMKRLFQEERETRLPIFWSANVERMLMGFSLENLVKALILMSPEKSELAFSKEGNLRWVVDSHDLIKLSEEAGVALVPEEKDLLDVLSTCATWAGRYPIPKNEHQLPRWRKPVPDRATLLRRRCREIETAVSQGKPIQISKQDRLQGGIGHNELAAYRKFFDRVTREIRNLKAEAAGA